MAVWRSFDITESNGLKVDAVIALKFPAYLVQHERKIVWLIHQHRSAYELWDHPRLRRPLAAGGRRRSVRDMVWQADRVALGEAKRDLHELANVQDRLWNSMRLSSDVAVPPLAAHGGAARDGTRARRRLRLPPGSPGGAEAAVPGDRGDAARAQRRPARARGLGPRRAGAPRSGAGGRASDPACRSRSASRDERLHELYLGALAVHYGPFDEDYGYVTLEGFAAHRPVVTTTDAGGPLEFVTDGETGLVTAPEPEGDRGGLRPALRRPGARRAAGRRRQRGGARPRAGAGPTSSRGCWTDAMAARAKDLARVARQAVPAAPGVGRADASAARVLRAAPAGADRRRDVLAGRAGRAAADRLLRAAPHGRRVAAGAEARGPRALVPARRVLARQQRGVPPRPVPVRVPGARARSCCTTSRSTTSCGA